MELRFLATYDVFWDIEPSVAEYLRLQTRGLETFIAYWPSVLLCRRDFDVSKQMQQGLKGHGAA